MVDFGTIEFPDHENMGKDTGMKSISALKTEI